MPASLSVVGHAACVVPVALASFAVLVAGVPVPITVYASQSSPVVLHPAFVVVDPADVVADPFELEVDQPAVASGQVVAVEEAVPFEFLEEQAVVGHPLDDVVAVPLVAADLKSEVEAQYGVGSSVAEVLTEAG